MLIASDAAPATVIVAPAAKEDRVAELERQVAEQAQRIERLEAMLLRQASSDRAPPAPVPVAAAEKPPLPLRDAPPASVRGPAVAGLTVGGDVRLRQEFNFSDPDARDRSRNALRARLRAAYSPVPGLTVGAQLVTGDPDDPNSTDVTLGDFVDDLTVSLDQVWLRYQTGGLTISGGKFPLTFQRTDMVWDGDFVPQGGAISYATRTSGGTSLEARGAYVIIEESAAGRGSAMLGGQLVASMPLARDWRLGLAGAYYDYSLHGLATADVGDFRSNLMTGGRYLSDFRLVDGIATLAYGGLGPRWPLLLTFEYVHNFGAAVSADSGINVELAVGQAAKRGDWRMAYGYSQVGVDAVFAAFSHDNLAIATNYQLHSLAVAYVPARNLVLDVSLAHYRPLDAAYTGSISPTDWRNRMRVNLTVNF